MEVKMCFIFLLRRRRRTKTKWRSLEKSLTHSTWLWWSGAASQPPWVSDSLYPFTSAIGAQWIWILWSLNMAKMKKSIELFNLPLRPLYFPWFWVLPVLLLIILTHIISLMFFRYPLRPVQITWSFPWQVWDSVLVW